MEKEYAVKFGFYLLKTLKLEKTETYYLTSDNEDIKEIAMDYAIELNENDKNNKYSIIPIDIKRIY